MCGEEEGENVLCSMCMAGGGGGLGFVLGLSGVATDFEARRKRKIGLYKLEIRPSPSNSEVLQERKLYK